MYIVTAGPVAHLELEIAQDDGTEDDIEIAMKLDVTRTDEGVVKVADLRGSQVRPRADRIFDSAVGGEQPYPAGAVVCGGRLGRPLYRSE